MRWPTVGRVVERAAAMDYLASHAGVVICGEAGVGKTHLAREVAQSSVGRDGNRFTHVPVVATGASGTIPLAALESILTGLGATPTAGAGAPNGAAELVRVLGSVLQERSGGREVLLQVEDADLLDDASAEALASLCRLSRLRLLLTLRNSSSAPLPLTHLWKDEVVGRVDLEPFDLMITGELMGSALGGPVAADTVLAVWKRTRGNARFVTELVRSAVASGDLALREGAWLWNERGGLGPRLVDLAVAELDQLPGSQRHVVEMVAFAEPVPAQELVRLVDGEALDAVLNSGVVVQDSDDWMQSPGGSLRMRYPLMAETVRHLVRPERRRSLFSEMFHGRSASSASPQRSLPRLVRSVAWALECGVEVPVKYLLEATSAAERLAQHDYVERVATTVLTSPEAHDTDRIDAWAARSTARRFLNRPAAARVDLTEASALLRSRGPEGVEHYPHRTVMLSELRANLEQYGSDSPEDAEVEAEATRRHLSGIVSPSHSAYQDLEAGALARRVWAGHFEETLEKASQVVADRRQPLRRRLPLVAPTALGIAQQGALLDACSFVEAYVEEALMHTEVLPWVASEVLSARFLIRLWLGDTADLPDELALPAPVERPFLNHDPVVAQFGDARLAAARQEWSMAAHHLAAVSSRLGRTDPNGLLAMSLVYQAQAAAAQGCAAEARQLSQQARATPLRLSRVFECDLRTTALSVSVALGESDAQRQAIELADWCAARGLALGEMWASHLGVVSQVRHSADLEALAERTQRVAARVQGGLAQLYADHAKAVAEGDRGVASSLVRELARRGAWVPVARDTGLTGRQREVAWLAAKGLTSREIATSLGVSVRTVDSHLSTVYARLGVKRRSDLAAALSSW